MTTAVRRRAPASVAAAGLALLTVLAGSAGEAEAAAYRYWSFWTWDGDSWAYSNTGPPGRVHDGDVIGWRFATQPDSSSAVAPRGSGRSLCADGVSVFIDYGSGGDAPPGEQPPSPRAFCADDDDSNNGYRATEEHATLRVRSDGLVCGIDGYPEEECGQKVSSEPPATGSPRRSASTEDPPRDRVDKKGSAPQPRTPASPSTSPQPGNSPSGTSPSTTANPSSSAGAPQDEAVAPSPTTTFALNESAPNQGDGDGEGVPVGPIVGGVAIVAVAGAAVWQHRRSTR